MKHWKAYAFWTWRCIHDDCFGHSRKPTSRKKAKRYGIRHMREIHNDYDSEPRLIKVGG